MAREKPVDNEIYHIYNRGVEKRNVFLNEKDYFRFIHDLYEFNDTAAAFDFRKKGDLELQKLSMFGSPITMGRQASKNSMLGSPTFRGSWTSGTSGNASRNKSRELIVEIICFCLMPNHFHLMVRQKIENGISKFMHKLGTGYTNYFNQKYKHTGALFQGKYKIVRLKSNAHFIHLPYYIHSNPLDLFFPEWKEKKIEDFGRAIEFLENYRWSSYLDYIGKKNFPSVTQREFLEDFYQGSEHYKKNMTDWLKEINLAAMKGLLLE